MRNIAILRDGPSDFLVIQKFLKCVFDKHKGEVLDDSMFIDLGNQLNIINILNKYQDTIARSSNYSYHSADAISFIKELHTTYYACYNKIKRENDFVTRNDIIVIYADSEKPLMDRLNYFNDWAYHIKGMINYSIECFYEELIKQNHDYEYIPLIVPLILFPSSEILVASCMFNLTTEHYLRRYKPNPDLKQKVYGTSSIHEAYASGNLVNTLNNHLTIENLNSIYKEIPEARLLMQNLIN